MNDSPSIISEAAILIWATIGGLLVAGGLIIEKFADWLDGRFLGGYKAHKALELSGWWILLLGILVEIADAGWTAHEIKKAESMADLNKKPIFAFSAYAYLVAEPLDHEADLENTNLPAMMWAPNCALFPLRTIPQGNGDSLWLELGQASKMSNGASAQESSVSSDCVIKTIALYGDKKFLRFDIYFGIDADKKTVPTSNRSFQNSPLTPNDLNAINLLLPIRGNIVEGRIEMNIDNGQIERSFQFPKQLTFGTSASCTESNGVFSPINWSPEIRASFEKAESIRLKKSTDAAAFLTNGLRLETDANGDNIKSRIISDEQKKLFKSLLENYPKTPIKVFVNPRNPESLTYAKQIRQLLDVADYGVSDGGLITNTADIYTGTNFNKWKPTPHTLVFAALPDQKWGWIIPIHDTFDNFKPVISSGLTNDPTVYALGCLDCVRWAFTGIGLNGFYIGNATNILKRGEAGIIVPAEAK